MVQVVVIDDHPAIRAGIRAMLEGVAGVVVAGEASNRQEALSICADARPDVALVDLRLGAEDGISVIEDLAELGSATRAIVLTTFDGDEAIHRALAAGARGYVLKHATAEEIAQAIQAVAAGRRYLPEDVVRRLAAHGPRISLTAREQDVLALLAEGLRNKEIAARLGMGEATVRTHVQAILGKFGCHDRGAVIAQAIARGFFTGLSAEGGA